MILSHHHPDHTMNVALFGHARVHDTWAIYQRDTWFERDADGAQLSAHVRLMTTPGIQRRDKHLLSEMKQWGWSLEHSGPMVLASPGTHRSHKS